MSQGRQSTRWPSISVQPRPDSMNSIASHEWRWTVVVVCGASSCSVASRFFVGRSPSYPAYTPLRMRRAGTSCSFTSLRLMTVLW
ncbi:hypothetical protein BH18CHL2_BH18CHL2_01270 [soil metagenome]